MKTIVANKPVAIYKAIEFLVLFIFIPVSYAFEYNPIIKGCIGLAGFIYLIYILLKVEKISFKINRGLDWPRFWQTTLVKLGLIIFITCLYVYLVAPDKLFNVLLNKPKLYVIILFVYAFFSVYPQEVLYRTFFFNRYEQFFTSKYQIVFINAIIFSLAHIFLKNMLVAVLTFVGGLLFAYTYYNERSTLMVSVEHAIYGSWLFTVGMGDMLAFPS
ncbi:CPBP family intramembrane glutamic endopeptidase [Spongiivirga sp. MCCC 1A20706]|uniref:CPBP family intramembrane glutamic endopeptidase n=1 Tax=Spongiivirga sp. MCCC 1A20706 TaxID=3160963 RepID=UPI003977DD2C